jgi:hypothetical protein
VNWLILSNGGGGVPSETVICFRVPLEQTRNCQISNEDLTETKSLTYGFRLSVLVLTCTLITSDYIPILSAGQVIAAGSSPAQSFLVSGPVGTRDIIFFSRLLRVLKWGLLFEGCDYCWTLPTPLRNGSGTHNSVTTNFDWLLSCCWPSPAYWYLVPSPTRLTTIFYCLMARGAFRTLFSVSSATLSYKSTPSIVSHVTILWPLMCKPVSETLGLFRVSVAGGPRKLTFSNKWHWGSRTVNAMKNHLLKSQRNCSDYDFARYIACVTEQLLASHAELVSRGTVATEHCMRSFCNGSWTREGR